MTIRYLLDTDTCVGWLRQNQAVRRRVIDASPAALGLSLITLSELRYGAACSIHPDANHQAIDAFLSGVALIGLDSAIARQFGDTKALLRVQGQLLEDADLLIASTALTYQLILVTNNTNHFARIPNLIIAGAGEVGVAGQFCRGRALQVNTILNHVIVMAMVHGSGYGKLGEEALLR